MGAMEDAVTGGLSIQRFFQGLLVVDSGYQRHNDRIENDRYYPDQ